VIILITPQKGGIMAYLLHLFNMGADLADIKRGSVNLTNLKIKSNKSKEFHLCG